MVFENKLDVDIVFTDCKEAFDKVDHRNLIQKLNKFVSHRGKGKPQDYITVNFLKGHNESVSMIVVCAKSQSGILCTLIPCD